MTPFRTQHGLIVERYFSGPTPQEIQQIESLSIQVGLCRKNEHNGVKVTILPVDRLYGIGGPLEKGLGVAKTNPDGSIEVIIAGRCNDPCDTLLHELTHACK